MKNKILYFLLFFVLAIVSLPYVFADLDTIEVRVILVSDNENDVTHVLNLKVGSVINFTGLNENEYDFAYYIVNGVVRDNLNENSTILASDNQEILVVYKAKEGKNPVIFIDTNGKIIGDILYVSDNESVNSPNANWSNYTKPNYNLLLEEDVPVWKSLVGSNSLSSINEPSVFSLSYELVDGVESVTINESEYDYNEIVTLESIDSNFKAWVDSDGNVLSYSSTYKFTAIIDLTIYEVTEELVEKPLVTLLDVTGIRENYNSYLGSYYLPSGYEFIETGVMVGSNKLQSNSIHPTTNEFLRSIPNEDVNDVIRSYLTYKHNGLVETIYDKDLGVTFGNDPYNETATTSVSGVGLALYYDAKENGVNISPSNVEFIHISGPSTPTFGSLDKMDIHYVRFTEPGDYVIKLRVKDKNNQYIDAEKTHTITVSSGNNKMAVRNIYPNNISANPDYGHGEPPFNEYMIVGKNFTSYKRIQEDINRQRWYASAFVGYGDFEGGHALNNFTISFKYTSYNTPWKVLFRVFSGNENGADALAGDWLRLLTNRNQIGIWGDTKQDSEYQDEGEATKNIPLNSAPVYIKFVREFTGNDVELRLYTSLDGETYTLQTTVSHPNANKANGEIGAKLTGFCIYSCDNDFIIEDLEVLGTAFSLS